jgi:hypothetical protein
MAAVIRTMFPHYPHATAIYREHFKRIVEIAEC